MTFGAWTLITVGMVIQTGIAAQQDDPDLLWCVVAAAICGAVAVFTGVRYFLGR